MTQLPQDLDDAAQAVVQDISPGTLNEAHVRLPHARKPGQLHLCQSSLCAGPPDVSRQTKADT